MSIPAFNQTVVRSPGQVDHERAGPGTQRPGTSSSPRHPEGMNYAPTGGHCGPVFDPPAQKPFPGHCHSSCPPQRPLPVGARPNPGPVPRPNPAQPSALAQQLLDNYHAFKVPPLQRVTADGVRAMANQALTGDSVKDANIRLARNLLQHPGLLAALDRNGKTGIEDGHLTKADIKSFIRSDNPLKLHSDKQLAQELLDQFGKLATGYFPRSIKLGKLDQLAMQQPTGNASQDALIHLAKELMARPELKAAMDSLFQSKRDDMISRRELQTLLTVLG
ncbi:MULTISPECIES: hypothetical protein [unclassified Pseudomonas]|uniref:hypothetical protein n=1 Tax=unclassified Pseudomonas TaxID=196821 RepID=UPI002115280B|nr:MULTISPECIES: hypothetical protein [unclassified Pseudomonas]